WWKPCRLRCVGSEGRGDVARPCRSLRSGRRGLSRQGGHGARCSSTGHAPREGDSGRRVAWRLASTSLWRTAAPNVLASPDHAHFLQSGQKAKRRVRSVAGRTIPARGAFLFAPSRMTLGGNEPRACGYRGGPRNCKTYLIATFAPASSSFFLAASESALEMPSLTGFGAPSTRSLASLRPRPVISRTALITLTLFSPNDVSMTVNSVFSSAAAAGAPPPAAG